jgi:3-oxoacyl-[acyl-carrier protein] reductase
MRLAEEGAAVAILDVNPEAANETAKQIGRAGGKALTYEVDVAKGADVEAAVEAVLATSGRIDMLVNNAGISQPVTVARMTEDDWTRTLDINLKGAFLCSRAVIQPMRERRYGKIVNIASIMGIVGGPGQAHYSAAKSGIIGFTRSLAMELGSFNINVNAIGPGIVDTPILEQDGGPELRERLRSVVPLRRIGVPRDVANAVLFLASDEASYVTGQCLFVCGGWSASAGVRPLF